jgi:hypothetical protein
MELLADRAQSHKPRILRAVLQESRSAPLPLGWSLSQAAQDEMALQVDRWIRYDPDMEFLDSLLAPGRMASQ